jgi:hypothetical protein
MVKEVEKITDSRFMNESDLTVDGFHGWTKALLKGVVETALHENGFMTHFASCNIVLEDLGMKNEEKGRKKRVIGKARVMKQGKGDTVAMLGIDVDYDRERGEESRESAAITTITIPKDDQMKVREECTSDVTKGIMDLIEQANLEKHSEKVYLQNDIDKEIYNFVNENDAVRDFCREMAKES